ncbi:MAG TPA: GNAT family N-acetyltransferase [Steroidobacteraceae bacterium]|nr:GNAT family N-acetyltransferase [Steroidobacteraceae bacterium]
MSTTPAQPPPVREAGLEDLPAIVDIYNDVLATSTAIFSDQADTLAQRTQWWQARTAQDYPVIVAGAGEVAGFATFGDFRSWPGYRFTVEHTVHVRADRRGRGVGAALVTELIARAGRLGKHVMVGGIDAANARSIRFHERLGFERAGELREVGCKAGRWLNLVFMQRLLGSSAQ